MVKLPRIVLQVLVLTLAAILPAFAWGDIGHMAVAYVAYNKLTSNAKKRVDALIRLNPRVHAWELAIPAHTPAKDRSRMLFMMAATWPDSIKGDGQHVSDGSNDGNTPPSDGSATRNIGYSDKAMHKYWHFVDSAFSSDGTPIEAMPVPNAQTQIAAFRAVLASNKPDTLKSYDLVWLLHLVGDIHQPLHACARFNSASPHGDAGGNLVKLTGNPAKLHSFWDGLPGSGNSVLAAIAYGRSVGAAPTVSAADLDVASWVAESFSDARSKVYVAPVGPKNGPFTLTPTYRTKAAKLAKSRIALAGAWLAAILNTELR